MVVHSRSARYALFAAMELAVRPGGQVTAARVAERYGVPVAVTAKVFSQLARAGIVVGLRGAGGGYQLARRASEISILDIIRVFEPPAWSEAAVRAESRPASRHRHEVRLNDVIDEVNELVRCTFASITIETLVTGRRTLIAGPAAESGTAAAGSPSQDRRGGQAATPPYPRHCG
jgi:Rrf2 family protein